MKKILRVTSVFGLALIVFLIFVAFAGILRVKGAEGALGANIFRSGAATSPDGRDLPRLGISFEVAAVEAPLAPNALVDLQAVLTAFPEPVLPGGILTYTVDIINSGPEAATTVRMTDTLPANVTWISTEANQGGDCTTGTVCEFATLPAVSTANVTLTVEVSPSYSGSLINQVEVRSTDDDTNQGNNVDSVTTTVSGADLSLSKSGNPGTVMAGNPLTYTLTVTNLGPSDATGVVLTDTLPAGVTYVSSNLTCTPGTGTQRICALGTVTNGAATNVTIVVRVNSGTSGILTNGADVTSNVGDTNMTNNHADETTSVEQSADLSIIKLDDPDPVIAGAPLTYTLVITNNGPSDAIDVIVNDNFPTNTLNFVNAPPACTRAGPNINCQLGDLGVGLSTQVILQMEVKSGATNPLVNTATVSSGTPDLSPGNDQATENTTITFSADLSITKGGTPNPVTAGNPLTYTLTVTNLGPSDATNVGLVDTLPVSVTHVSSPPACTPGTGILTCDLGTLVSADSVDVTIVVTVDPGASGDLLNQVDVSSSDVTDPINTNDHAEKTTNVQRSADLSITKSDTPPDTVKPGGFLTYTLNVNNQGPSSAVNVEISDTIRAPMTFDQALSDPSCNETAGLVTCDLGTIPPDGSSGDVNIIVQVDSDAEGLLENTASVSSNTPDPNPDNDQATEFTNVLESADLAVTTSVQEQKNPGDMLDYVMTVINNGPIDATGVILTDTLPSEVTFVSSTPPCTLVLGSRRCDLGAIASGNFKLVTLVGEIDNYASGVITNTAQVSSDLYDAIPEDNLDLAFTTVGEGADLSVVKTASPDPVTAGDVLTYSLTVNNQGPSTAPPGITLTDTLPGNVNFLSSTPGSPTCTEASGVVSCDLSSIAAGATGEVTILVQVGSSALNLLNNQAGVQSIMYDPVKENNSISINTGVVRSSDLEVDIVDDPDPVGNGNALTYTVVVHNNGPSDARNVLMTDILPSAASLLSVDPSQGICNGTICQLGSIGAGASATVSIITIVDAVVPAVLTNTAQVTSQEPDPQAGNNYAVETTTVPDTGAPTITWVSPVGDNQVFNVGTEIIQLEVNAGDNVGIQRVDFFWWDHMNEQFIDIGSDTGAPYRVDFDTSILYFGFNQMYARAYDTTGNASNRPRILLYHQDKLFLPLVAR